MPGNGVIWRVRLLTVAAPRERNEPAALSTAEVQHQMMTFVNVTIDQWRVVTGSGRLTVSEAGVYSGYRTYIRKRVNRMVLEVLL